MEQKLHDLIESYREEFVKTLQEWIRIPSVKDDPAEGAPFGKEIGRMMDLAVETGKKMGFAARTFDGYACDFSLGDAEEKIAVLGHLDVVPVGDGWIKPPFGAEIEDGKLILVDYKTDAVNDPAELDGQMDAADYEAKIC